MKFGGGGFSTFEPERILGFVGNMVLITTTLPSQSKAAMDIM